MLGIEVVEVVVACVVVGIPPELSKPLGLPRELGRFCACTGLNKFTGGTLGLLLLLVVWGLKVVVVLAAACVVMVLLAVIGAAVVVDVELVGLVVVVVVVLVVVWGAAEDVNKLGGWVVDGGARIAVDCKPAVVAAARVLVAGLTLPEVATSSKLGDAVVLVPADGVNSCCGWLAVTCGSRACARDGFGWARFARVSTALAVVLLLVATLEDGNGVVGSAARSSSS